jgi:NAD-dependent DNA ligase
MSNNKEQKELELQVMAHRYLYYVLSEPVLTDFEYDLVERKAREVCAENSPVQGVGSDLAGDYNKKHIAAAKEYLKRAGKDHNRILRRNQL